MPGGRLTLKDRERIAAGLARGLSLAEIARQLSRPTSTIAREVSRNLGPAGYQAERAQQSTARRARRRGGPGPGPAAQASASQQAYGRDPAAVREFEERYTMALVQMGLPMMYARVLACLSLTDSGSLTSAELVARLRVSPATISKTMGYLEQQQLIGRIRDGRRERYVAGNDPWYRATVVSGDTSDALGATALDGAAILGPDTPAGARMREMGEFLTHIGADIRTCAEYWYAIMHGADPNEVSPRPPSVTG